MTSLSLDQATEAYRHRDFGRAKPLLDSIISGSADANEKSTARYLRARGYEDGIFEGGVDLSRAWEDFECLKEQKFYAAFVGCARILLKRDAKKNARQAISLCEESLLYKPRNPKAMMVMGDAYEHALKDLDLAARCYLRAFFGGLPAGLDYFSSLQFLRKRYVSAFFSKALYLMSKPVLELAFGKRSAFK